jgi:predicted amidohydrolase
MTWDLLLTGGRVVDPRHDVEGRRDVAVSDGRIAQVGSSLPRRARQILDVAGLLVVPGLIDLHTHLSSEFSGRVAQAMLARAGVTTAMDVAGPISDILDLAGRCGAGIQVGCLHGILPADLGGADPSEVRIRTAITSAMDTGAVGVKILGGHHPFTPEATTRIIEEANAQRAYVAIHCGTTATPGDINGLVETVRLKGENRLHVAHINSYCMGGVSSPLVETNQAVEILQAASGLITESYIARINGTWGTCVNGQPESARTRAALERRGFAPTEIGMEEAIRAGACLVHTIEGGSVTLGSGEEGVQVWRSLSTRVGISFQLDLALPQVLLATARRAGGRFLVDALATDGGGIPRNNMAKHGLDLVRLGLWNLTDFVQKTSIAPARILGLAERKAHLGEGADADLAALDPISGEVRLTVCRGQVVMYQEMCFGQRSTIVTTGRGAPAVRAAALEPLVIDLEKSGFYLNP